MSNYVKKLFKRDKKDKIGFVSSETLIPDVKLDIVNSMHQDMALTVSNIAKIYPKQFSMIKVILTEYAFLIEHVLVFRKTGNPQELFKKIQEFLIRSVEGYLEKYENDEIVDEEKKVKDIIVNGLIDIEEKIRISEGFIDGEEELLSEEPSKSHPLEDWGNKPVITKKGGLPNLDTPITDIKGIGEQTAQKFKEIGVNTLQEYVNYQQAQADKNEDNEENDIE